MAKVSIIIPIYNVEQYLEECLNSVVNQTLKDIEIILVDDCGNDNSIKIAQKFAQNDSRIKILHHKKNKGLGPARNTGLKAAKGEYVFFLDSDDYINEDILEKLYKRAKENNYEVVVSNSLAFTKETDEYTLNRIPDLNGWLNRKENTYCAVDQKNFLEAIFNIPCVAWGKLYHRGFLNKYNLEFIDKNRVHEDNGFWIKTCACMPKVAFLTDVGVNYRIRKNAITTEIDTLKQKRKKYAHMQSVLADALSYLKKNLPKELYKYYSDLIKNSEEYNKYFYFKYGFLYKYRWLKNEKIIRIFELPIFTERIGLNNKKHGRVLGIRVYKTDVETMPSCFQEDLSQIKSKKGSLIFKTNNQDENIINSLKNLNDFYFLPNKGNLGDIVIAASEFQYFNANNLNYKVYEIEKKYSEPFNFVYGGGGIWHKLYQKDYQEVIDIFKSPLLKKCVVLPSSFYDCEDAINSFDERFTVFCREKQSFEYCKSLNNKAQFILADDMVIGADFNVFKKPFLDFENFEQFKLNHINYESIYLYYYNKLKNAQYFLSQIEGTSPDPNPQCPTGKSIAKIGYLLRTDNESINKLDNIKTIDPSSLVGGFGCDIGLDFLFAKIFLATINKFDIVVTDRLHVGICAAKLGKQTLLLDNSYKKLSEVYKNSLYKYKNVKLTTKETLEEDIKNIKKRSCKKTDLFKTIPVNFDDFLLQYGSFENEYGIERNLW